MLQSATFKDRPSFVHAVRRHHYYPAMVATLTSPNDHTIGRQERWVFTLICFKPRGAMSKESSNHREHVSAQKRIVEGFCSKVVSSFALGCPTGCS